jgi:hypothetical protein
MLISEHILVTMKQHIKEEEDTASEKGIPL